MPTDRNNQSDLEFVLIRMLPVLLFSILVLVKAWNRICDQDSDDSFVYLADEFPFVVWQASVYRFFAVIFIFILRKGSSEGCLLQYSNRPRSW